MVLFDGAVLGTVRAPAERGGAHRGTARHTAARCGALQLGTMNLFFDRSKDTIGQRCALRADTFQFFKRKTSLEKNHSRCAHDFRDTDFVFPV